MSQQQPEAKVISEVKEKITEVIPTLAEATQTSSAQALKDRLDWGEPALTIVDTRDRDSYLEERIIGAILLSDINNLATNRDIYVYGLSKEEVAEATNNLRQAGYKNVCELQGGLAGWKAINGVTEGRAA